MKGGDAGDIDTRYTVLSVVRIGYYSSYLPILSSLLDIEGGRSSRLMGKEASFYPVENVHSLFVCSCTSSSSPSGAPCSATDYYL